MKRKAEIIVANFQDWTISIISKDDDDVIPKLKHIIKYVYCYLRNGNGSFMKRLVSVLTKALTASLKPVQASEAYRHDKTPLLKKGLPDDVSHNPGTERRYTSLPEMR